MARAVTETATRVEWEPNIRECLRVAHWTTVADPGQQIDLFGLSLDQTSARPRPLAPGMTQTDISLSAIDFEAALRKLLATARSERANIGCVACERCEQCSECCTASAYLVRCFDCSSCTYCFGCVGLYKSDFSILNQRYDRATYFELT